MKRVVRGQNRNCCVGTEKSLEGNLCLAGSWEVLVCFSVPADTLSQTNMEPKNGLEHLLTY